MSALTVKPYWQAAHELLALVRRHRQLTWEMTRREIKDKYAGQLLGAFWAFGHPLVQIAVYIYVFVFVFKVRVGGTAEFPGDYSTYLLGGLIPWLAFSEVMNKATVTVTGNANLVKQVVFPLEVLPVKTVLASFLTQLISTLILAGYVLVTQQTLPWTFALLPLLFGCQVLAMIGVACALSALGAYFRDLKELVQIGSVVGIYLMPVVYLPDMVPPGFRFALYCNPFSYMAWCYQDACCFGCLAHPWAWAAFAGLSLCVFGIGCAIFRTLKPMFGSVL